MSQYTLWCRQTWQENPRTDWRLISLGKSWIFDGPWLQSHANCDSWHRRVIQMSTMSSWRQVDADVLCPSGSQEQIQYWLVGGLEHFYIFPYIGNVIIPTDEHIFQRGRYTTNQLNISPLIDDFTHIEWTLVAQRRCQHRWSRGIGGALWGSWNRCWNPSYRAPCASWGSESRPFEIRSSCCWRVPWKGEGRGLSGRCVLYIFYYIILHICYIICILY